VYNTNRFKKRPDIFSKEEFDLAVKANFLEFIAQLECITFEGWDLAATPIEEKLADYVVQRGLVKGKL
jgi:hypothetical protein